MDNKPVIKCPPGSAAGAEHAWPQRASVRYGDRLHQIPEVEAAGHDSSSLLPNTMAMARHALLFKPPPPTRTRKTRRER